MASVTTKPRLPPPVMRLPSSDDLVWPEEPKTLQDHLEVQQKLAAYHAKL
jgi:hypothetical protein